MPPQCSPLSTCSPSPPSIRPRREGRPSGSCLPSPHSPLLPADMQHHGLMKLQRSEPLRENSYGEGAALCPLSRIFRSTGISRPVLKGVTSISLEFVVSTM